jgi:hypothetical protein
VVTAAAVAVAAAAAEAVEADSRARAPRTSGGRYHEVRRPALRGTAEDGAGGVPPRMPGRSPSMSAEGRQETLTVCVCV